MPARRPRAARRGARTRQGGGIVAQCASAIRRLRQGDGCPERLRRAGRYRVPRAAGGMNVAQPLPLAADLALDLRGRLAVALCAAWESVEAQRLAPRDGHRREVAELPLERAVDRAADEWNVLLQRDHRGPRLRRARHTGALPCPF